MDDPLPSENPYAPPQSEVSHVLAPEAVTHYEPASRGKRFAHLIVDQFAAMGVLMAVVFTVGIAGAMAGREELVDQLFGESSGLLGNLMGIWVMGAYYLATEGIFGRTLGKLITGTRVVNWRTGQKAGWGALIGRTFARFVPFEAFSFLGAGPGGWHDNWSGTMVVDMKKPLPPAQAGSAGPRFFPGR